MRWPPERREKLKDSDMNVKTSPPLSDIRRDFERVSPAIVKKASTFAASILADVAGRRGTLDGRIKPLSHSTRLAGPAFTIEVRAGDNLMIHAAMSMAKPGDVLVVDGKADRTCALMGSIMINACKKLGLAGVILDAAHRDTEELLELGFPFYSVGSNPNGPTKFVPGRINWPISCGGVAINPGDLIVGDADGVVVIEREKAESLLDLAAKKVADERERIADIVAGRNLRPKWLEGSLRAAGVLKEGETL
jgi:4-hydroxy-4-methyl-2-oxoglutarate aldolase